jgi:hypothetical protein
VISRHRPILIDVLGRDGLAGRVTTLLLLVVVLLAMILATRAHLTSHVLPHDDAYIIFRYVENLLAGKGLVYNEGERVFGVSSPLYFLWLCTLKLFMPSRSLPVLAVRLNITFFLLSAAAAYAIVCRWSEKRPLACFAAVFFCINEGLLEDSLGGMESFMFSALTLWSLYFVSRGAYIGSGLLSGLSALARPEGVLVAATCTVAWLIYSRRSFPRYVLALCLPSLVWLLFAQTYFGTVVPHSILAKARPLYPLPRGDGLVQMVNHITAWTFGERLWTARAIRPAMALQLAEIAILAVVGSATLRALKAWTAALLFALFIIFYSVTNAAVSPWYLPTVYTVWLILLLVGTPITMDWLSRRWCPRGLGGGWITSLRYVPLALVLVFSNVDGIREMRANQWIPKPSSIRLRVVGYERAARWMNLHFPQGTRVAAPEIGALGYYWDGPVLDVCGLVSSEALPFLPVPDDQRDSPYVGAISSELVEILRPDAIATLAIFARRSLLATAWFHTMYELVHREPLPETVWESPDVLIYRLRHTPGEPPASEGK